MTRLNKEIRELSITELNIDELDEFSGGSMIVAGCPSATPGPGGEGPYDPNPNPFGTGGG